MPVAAFGERARRWATRLDPSLPAIVTDESGVAEAMLEASNRRLRGETFYGAILLDDPWSRAAVIGGESIIAQNASYDERRARFDELAETVGISYPYETLRSLRHFSALTDATLVRSWTEYERVARALNERRSFVETILAPDPFLANCTVVPEGREIVVWAPDTPAPQLAIILFAVEEMYWPVTVVCRGSSSASRARFVPKAEGLEALRRACVIVDASQSDPAPAVALARLGLPMLTASTSGAHEYVQGTIVYEPHKWRRIAGGVTAALAANPVRLRTQSAPTDHRDALRAAAPVPFRDGPLVTIIIPTYNRPASLDRTLAQIQLQVDRYPHIECIVVNDGETPVDEIVAKYPFVHLIKNERNIGMLLSFNKGLSVANGKYVCFAADDDPLYPDQVQRLVYALERTGAQVGHGNHLERNCEPDGAGGYRTAGFGTVTRGYLDRTALLANSTTPTATMLTETALVKDVGGWDNNLKMIHDYELLLRLAERADFVHVDNVLAEANHFADEESQTQKLIHTHESYFREIYKRYPAEGRPHVEAARQKVIAWYVAAAQGREPVWAQATAVRRTDDEEKSVP